MFTYDNFGGNLHVTIISVIFFFFFSSSLFLMSESGELLAGA